MRSPLPMRGLALACLLAAASDASASGLQIAPTSIEMAAAGPAQALWLTNTGEHELRAQVRAYKWSQTGGKDAFIGSNSALVAPVKIGDGAYIGSGSVITADVPAGALALGRGRQTIKEGWAKRLKDLKSLIKKKA